MIACMVNDADAEARVRYEAYCTRNGVALIDWSSLALLFRQQWEPRVEEPVRKPAGRAECIDAIRKQA